VVVVDVAILFLLPLSSPLLKHVVAAIDPFCMIVGGKQMQLRDGTFQNNAKMTTLSDRKHSERQRTCKNGIPPPVGSDTIVDHPLAMMFFRRDDGRGIYPSHSDGVVEDMSSVQKYEHNCFAFQFSTIFY